MNQAITDQDWHLCIEEGPFSQIKVSLYESGKKVSIYQDYIDSDLRYILKKSVSYTNIETMLVEYLQNTFSGGKLLVKARRQLLEVDLDLSMNQQEGFVFNRLESMVQINQFENKSSQMILLGDSLVLDVESKRLGITSSTQDSTPSEMTQWIKLIKKQCGLEKSASSFQIPLVDFHQPGLRCASLKSCHSWQYQMNHDPQSIHHFDVEWQLDYHDKSAKNWVYLKLKNQWGLDIVDETIVTQLINYYHRLFERNELDVDKVQQLIDECLSIINQTDDVESRCAELSMFSDFLSDHPKIDWNHFYQPLSLDDHWVIGHFDPVMYILIVLVFHQVFQRSFWFDSEMGSFQVDTDLFQQKLASLTIQMQQLGIILTKSEKPIQVSNWDVDIEFGEDNEPIITVSDGVNVVPESVWSSINWTEFLENDAQQVWLSDETRDRLKLLVMTKDFISANADAPEKSSSKMAIIDWCSLINKGANVQMTDHQKNMVVQLMRQDDKVTIPVPKKLQAQPRNYQHIGYQWLSFLYQHELGGILSDDMGLGKTMQSIMLLAAIKENVISRHTNHPHLIVLPPSLIFNWSQEISRFYPELTMSEYREWVNLPVKTKESVDIVLISYEMVRRDIETLIEQPFDCIIFDETQLVKNLQAGRTLAVKRLQASVKIGLTGTPFENNLAEFYSVMDLVVPGLLGTYQRFQKWIGDEYKGIVLNRIKPFVLRRTKEMICEELPDKIESDVYLDLSPSQKSMYQFIVESLKKEFLPKNSAANQGVISFLAALMRLRQICVSPALIDKEYQEDSPKINYLVRSVQELILEGHSALIFSQFTSALDLVQAAFEKQKFPFCRIDGKTSKKKRQTIINQFQESKDPGVMLLSLKVGGVGLNLTKASYVFHLDPWWNPAVENQASDRVHRIGQTKQVMIRRLIMHGSIEEKLMVLKEKKMTLFKSVMNDYTINELGDTRFSKKDMEFLLED